MVTVRENPPQKGRIFSGLGRIEIICPDYVDMLFQVNVSFFFAIKEPPKILEEQVISFGGHCKFRYIFLSLSLM